MGNPSKNKLRILHLLDILKTRTDDEHILSSGELITLLDERGFSADRKSIYDDIACLTSFGYDVILTHSPKKGYFLGQREFELAEVRLLSDAVQAANFISESKSKALIEKIEKSISGYQASQLRDQVYIDSKTKTKNEEIYYNIDKINEAIKSSRQIRFVYRKRRMADKYTTVHDEKELTVNPYAMIWSNDHYYLICNNPKYDNLMHARIDRMKKVEILDIPAAKYTEVSDYKNGFDAADYSKKHFNMFSGDVEQIELICNCDLIDAMIDKFGDGIAIKSVSDTSFSFRTQAAVNDGLASWIMQYSDKIFVKSPAALKNMIEKKCRDILASYSKGESENI